MVVPAPCHPRSMLVNGDETISGRAQLDDCDPNTVLAAAIGLLLLSVLVSCLFICSAPRSLTHLPVLCMASSQAQQICAPPLISRGTCAGEPCTDGVRSVWLSMTAVYVILFFPQLWSVLGTRRPEPVRFWLHIIDDVNNVQVQSTA